MAFEIPRYPDGVFYLFRKLVNEPYRNHEETDAWIDEVLETDSEYHRREILKQGRANFSEGFNGLTPDDIVLLYCNYYMQMHVASGYYVFSQGNSLFNEYLLQRRKNIVFIDFGCGPLTSGIALAWYYIELQDSDNSQKLRFDYLGIDSCKSMLSKAEQASRYSELFDVANCTFDFRESFQDDESIIEWIYCSISRARPYRRLEYLVILNFSYFFASETLDVKNLVHITEKIIEQYGDEHKICIVFQNPSVWQLNKKWDEFKRHFDFISLVDGEETIKYCNTKSAYNEEGRSLYKKIELKYELMIHEPN